MSKYIVCITGERDNRGFREQIVDNICRLYMDKENIKFIFGDCSGVDIDAKEICTNLNIEYEVFPADWKKLGLKAGPVRNAQMIELADHVLAFHSDLKKSKGTKNTIKLAKKKGIPIEIFDNLL